jgi:hypothetical protein
MVETLPVPQQTSLDRIPKEKPVRQQPEGLRMRFRPFGAQYIGEKADSDVMGLNEGSPERTKKRSKSSLENKEKKKKHRKRAKDAGYP